MTMTLTNVSVGNTVTVANQQVTLPADQVYELVTNTNMWFKLGSNPTAAAATTGNVYLPSGQRVYVSTSAGNVKLAVIRDTLDGFCCITRVM